MIEYEHYFIEEAVFLRIKQIEELGQADHVCAFHHERTRLYDATNNSDRNKIFQEFFLKTFFELGIHRHFESVVEEFPIFKNSSTEILIKSTYRKKEESAELFVDSNVKKVVVKLRLPRILNPDFLLRFLRHELFHVADMLDPRFGYIPNPKLGGDSQMENNLIRDRFRLLWNIYVSSRLNQRGHESFLALSELRDEFEGAFSFFTEDRKAEVISNLVGKQTWTQTALIELARNMDVNKTLGEGGLRCPLCHFTSYETKRLWGAEQEPIVDQIKMDFPKWLPKKGICTQCFDLYESRTKAVVM